MPELEVTLKIKLKVEEQEDKDYYLDPKTSEATANFVADLMDEMQDSFAGEVLSINGLTPEHVHKILQAQSF